MAINYITISIRYFFCFIRGTFFSFLFNLICIPDLNNAERRLGSILYFMEFFIKNSLGMVLLH